MIALFIRSDVAIDLQIGLAAAAGLKAVTIALSSVEALGTMRFRSMLERHGMKAAFIYGHPCDRDTDRLRVIARVLGAEPVPGGEGGGWPRLEIEATQDLPAMLRARSGAFMPSAANLELAPTRAAWRAVPGAVWSR